MSRAWVWVLLVTACGGSVPEAASASSPPTSEEAAPAKGRPPESESEAEKPAGSSSDSHPDEAGSKQGATAGDPDFKENATVDEAMAAIPKGTPRANIDEETLGEPLQNAALYEPCKVGTQHFKLRVAVWNGHAVGVDVTTTNKALASCIDKQVRGVEWRHKARSLNTVDYSM
jgi:hypothetical protein